MAMNFKTPNGDVSPDMNTTPLIDVMLVLLVLLIITLPIQNHAVTLTLPTALQFSDRPPAVDVSVDFDGTISWDGKVVNRATLDARFSELAKQESQPDVRVTADRLARYDTVAKVLADAQRLGVTHIGIVGTQSYVNG